jgi:hypothetical protein
MTRQLAIQRRPAATAAALVSSPSPSSTGRNLLFAVTATTPSSAWAVGSYPNSSFVQTTLILHWNGTKWSRA